MEENRSVAKKRIVVFLAINFLISTVFYFFLIKYGMDAGNGGYVHALMWCPAIAALVTCKLLNKDVAELGWKWGRTRYQMASYLIPLGYTFVAYLFTWISGLGHFYNDEMVQKLAAIFGWQGLSPVIVIILYFVFAGTFGMISNSAYALGEEIGWRGFLVPELAKVTGFTGTALISGLIWAIWHFPVLLFGGYNAGTPAWYGLLCFTTMVLAISFVFAWMRLKSGSLWTAVFLHASHNLFIQQIFTPLTEDTGKTAYVIDEFGAALPIVGILLAFVFWKKRSELE